MSLYRPAKSFTRFIPSSTAPACRVYGANLAVMKDFVTDFVVIVDARGHRCPVPTLKLRRACERAAPGSVVRLLSDDPLARIDAPHFASQAGIELLGIETSGPVLSITVRKPAS